MTPEQRENLIWDPENHIAWTTYFNKRHKRELVDYNGLPAAPARSNSAGLTRWWGMPGRMLPYVLEYIENDNQRPLQAPPQELLVAEEDGHFFVVHLRHLLLRRLLATTPTMPRTTFTRVKDEPMDTPPHTRSRGIAINVSRRAPWPPLLPDYYQYNHKRLIFQEF